MITRKDFEKKYGTKLNSFANWEDIETALQSDEWEPVFSEFVFNPEDIDKHFTFIEPSNTWYPKKETFLDILEKCGIDLCKIDNTNHEIVEYVQRRININPLLVKSDFDEETIRLMDISVKVTKAGIRRTGDGQFRTSGAQSAEHPFYNKAVAMWNKEEAFTEGYTKFSYTDKYGKEHKIYPKYQSYYKRKSHLDTLKIHALGIARTKAINAVVSILAGLPTGFNKELLNYGCFGFVKFVRSKQYQKLYTMAKLDAIRKGNTAQIEKISAETFGTNQIEAPIQSDLQDAELTNFPESEDDIQNVELTDKPAELDAKTQIKIIIEKYINNNGENENLYTIKNTPRAYNYICSNLDNWDKIDETKAIDLLSKIESIKGIIKIDHQEFKDNSEVDIFKKGKL
jgi:hypothetical protein